MPARAFVRMARLLPAYGGALMATARMERAEAAEQQAAQAQASAPVASAAQLRQLLGKVPAGALWADVREVKTGG